MSRSLWALTAEQLLLRTSSADPTPGGGAIASVTAAFGAALVHMAIEVTLAPRAGQTPDVDPRLEPARRRLADLRAGFALAADADVAEFDALMGAYRMPKEDDQQRATRQHAIDTAAVSATEAPLELAEQAMLAIQIGAEVKPLVKPTITSDVVAGCDLLRGAALAALRTADINLVALEQRTHPDAQAIRRRRDAIYQAAAAPAAQP